MVINWDSMIREATFVVDCVPLHLIIIIKSVAIYLILPKRIEKLNPINHQSSFRTVYNVFRVNKKEIMSINSNNDDKE